MTDAMRTFRKYLDTHGRLASEIRPILGLDPSTDRDDYDDEQTRFLTVAGFQSAALTVLALHPDSLTPENLRDLRTVVVALDNFLSPLGG